MVVLDLKEGEVEVLDREEGEVEVLDLEEEVEVEEEVAGFKIEEAVVVIVLDLVGKECRHLTGRR